MKNKQEMPEVLIHPSHKDVIAKEFNTSKQTVFMALKYMNNSDLGVNIRKAAHEMLIKEAKKVTY